MLTEVWQNKYIYFIEIYLLQCEILCGKLEIRDF